MKAILTFCRRNCGFTYFLILKILGKSVMTMKCILLTFAILTFSIVQIMAQVSHTKPTQMPGDTSRVEKARKKYQELFGAPPVMNNSDPELMTILQRLIFGEIFYVGNLDDKIRELITITALTANQNLPQLKSHTNAALNIGITPIEIREVVYQSAPFIGFPKVLNALDTINKVFISKGIKLPLENKGTVQEHQRFEKGREIQYLLYGDKMKENMEDLPDGLGESIPRILTESCFGDFYTRSGLDIKTRELLIFCVLVTLGGTERQMASHAVGNLKAGNDKETLISAMLHLYPYIGFPRISNGISIIKEAKPE
jgi:4-carboxymuconolactone decarboxylase